MTERPTFKSVCEFISKHWKEHHNFIRTPEEIFNYSPTGELWKIHEWHDEAKEHEERINNGNV